MFRLRNSGDKFIVMYAIRRHYVCKHTLRETSKKIPQFDVRGSVHHSTIHKEKSNKMQQCIKILLFHIYMKLNMLRATHRPSSGA